MSDRSFECDHAFKCVLLGDPGSGKSAFSLRHLNGEYKHRYIPTMGAIVHQLNFSTSEGLIRFNLWDTAGHAMYGGFRTGHYLMADCAILMFDLTKRESYDHLIDWYNDIITVCPQIPIVIVGNKSDLSQRVIQPSEIESLQIRGFQYYEISTKFNLNIELPLMWLAYLLIKQK